MNFSCLNDFLEVFAITLNQGFVQGYSTVLWILAKGLANLLRIADLHCRNFESTKWLKHKLRASIGGEKFKQSNGRSGFSFPLRFAGGQLEFVMQVFGDSPKLSSSGLAITMTNLMFRIYTQLHIKNISTSLRVCNSTICTKYNVQIGAGRHLQGFGQASLSGARRGYMPPQLGTKTKTFWRH